MPKLQVYNGKEWIEIAKDGKDAVVDYEYILSQIPVPKDGKDGFIDEATIGYLEEEIKRLEKKHGGYGRVIRELRAGTNITIDNTNLEYPIINATGGGAVSSVNGQTGVVVLDTDDVAEGAVNLYNKTHTGEVTGSVALTVDKTAITNKTAAVPVGADYILISDTSDSGNLKKALVSDLPSGGGSLTKGIAEVDFGAITQQSDIATVTVSDATITPTSYPTVALYAVANADHDPDDYMVESLSAYVTNVVAGVGFDISVRAPQLTWGRYTVTYQF